MWGMIAPMFLLIAYDAWFSGRVESLLKWLDDWLSISQKHAERGMIAGYLMLLIHGLPWTPAEAAMRILVAGSLGYLMWFMHRRPAAMRNATRRTPWYPAVRALLQVFMFSLAASVSWPFKHWADVTRQVAQQLIYIVFFYATDIAFDGSRGRKRKLALAELKKMFGVEWIPKPIPAPR